MWCLVTDDGRRIPLRRLPATVGAGSDADVVVEVAGVRPRHARVSQGPDGDLLLDALDEAPVEVGGWLVGRAGLRAGDEVSLGGARFTVVRQAEEPAPPARRPAAGAGRSATRAPARAPGDRRPAARAPRATEAPRRDATARARPVARRDALRRVGLMGSDVSQIGGGVKALVLLALLAAAAGIVWLAQLLVREL